MTKGIHSPWTKKEATKVEDEPLRAPDSRGDEAPPLPVRFPGRAYNLEVALVLPKRTKITAEQGQDLGRTVLGLALQELFKKAPPSVGVFTKQGLTSTPPFGPKVTFQLGTLVLYAKASSMDMDLALKMAVDRIALALTECRVTYPAASKILDDHRVDTVLRTT